VIINVAEAKSKFSHLLALVGIEETEVVISKRDKPMAVLLSYETFLKMKRELERKIEKTEIDRLPSSLDRYMGIVGEEELDKNYKESRENYLKKKYL